MGIYGISWYYMGVNEIKVAPNRLTNGFTLRKNRAITGEYFLWFTLRPSVLILAELWLNEGLVEAK